MLKFLKSLIGGVAAPKPAGPPKLVGRLDANSIQLISSNAQWSNGELEVNVSAGETVRLCEFELKDLEQCMLGLRFQMSTRDVQNTVYPEIWVRVAGFGEAFSKGLQHKLKGTNEWTSVELPFYLRANQKADLLKLNLVFAGSGSATLKNIELYSTPLES